MIRELLLGTAGAVCFFATASAHVTLETPQASIGAVQGGAASPARLRGLRHDRVANP